MMPATENGLQRSNAFHQQDVQPERRDRPTKEHRQDIARVLPVLW